MVKQKHCFQITPLCDCENQFRWPRIIARDVPIPQPPSIIVPEGMVIPRVNRYFYIVTSDIQLTNGATLAANLFSDDNGVNVPEFIITYPNGYVNLYINAVMQESGIYSVTPNALILNADNATIYRGTPIIIESLGFFNETH
ncbi:DUF4183 domain-containing protein [Lysinibacillus varians]|uniref:DUF4183 domain-containing protein n=1 Tax=Lysinibacillus varians TaxID=1145276 RepID=A0ABY2T7A2_9BACI|nr:DUF4183 domain-containing protein [Lysinibacillus varians]AHN21461.1 hypothetical protein T479_08385 [Lysinibacillus varians]TKI60012.1 DUF4183 domain-containing protein [Lysinibacillus varians]